MTHDGRHDRPGEQNGSKQAETLLDRQLDELLEQLEIEQAPPSLTRRLYRIPRDEGGRQGWWRWPLPGLSPRWVLAPALAAALLAVGVVLMLPRQPSQEEIFQAQQELAVDRDLHRVERVIKGRVLAVAVPVHTIERELQGSVLGSSLSVTFALLEELSIYPAKVFSEVLRIKSHGESDGRVVTRSVNIDDPVVIVRGNRTRLD